MINSRLPASRLALAVAAAALIAGCAAHVAKTVDPDRVEPVMRFDDWTYFHNVGIAWDGRQYYTLNGGNANHGRISVFDRQGKLKSSTSIDVDGRSIMYCRRDRKLYIKGYSTDLQVYNPKARLVTTRKRDVFHSSQSSVALDPDGRRIYELAGGTLYVRSFPGFDLIAEIEDISDEALPYNSTIAASGSFLYTWDDDGTVSVWDKQGAPVGEFELPSGRHGMSLTWANGLLWCAVDADGKDDGANGFWYGYSLGKGVR
jgi:DNA-binding beta-propeller fold protein YncE